MPAKKMSNALYGARARSRELFNRKASRDILGSDGALHVMNIKRKAGAGIGNFADITKPISASAIGFIRARLHRATKGAIQREWIGANPFAAIRRRIR